MSGRHVETDDVKAEWVPLTVTVGPDCSRCERVLSVLRKAGATAAALYGIDVLVLLVVALVMEATGRASGTVTGAALVWVWVTMTPLMVALALSVAAGAFYLVRWLWGVYTDRW